MTEAEWLAATDQGAILQLLHGRASERKLRLFACACCRRNWDRLTDDRSRQAVEAAERHADGAATDDELEDAATLAFRVVLGSQSSACPSATGAADAAHLVATVRLMVVLSPPYPTDAQWAAAGVVATAARSRGEGGGLTAERRSQFGLWLDIVGSGAAPVPDAEWFRWGGGTVPKLAGAAYNDRLLPEGILDPTRLAVLADALEDAGCADPELLGHLRGPGPHVRGCRVIDHLLGRS
jgi:hypothetical protein